MWWKHPYYVEPPRSIIYINLTVITFDGNYYIIAGTDDDDDGQPERMEEEKGEEGAEETQIPIIGWEDGRTHFSNHIYNRERKGYLLSFFFIQSEWAKRQVMHLETVGAHQKELRRDGM